MQQLHGLYLVTHLLSLDNTQTTINDFTSPCDVIYHFVIIGFLATASLTFLQTHMETIDAAEESGNDCSGIW